MPETTVFVTFKDKRVRVQFTNFDSLIRTAKTKFKLSTDFRLEHQTEDGTWVALCEDNDLVYVSPNSELKLVLEGSDGSGNRGFVTYGGTHEGENVIGNVDKRTVTGANLNERQDNGILDQILGSRFGWVILSAGIVVFAYYKYKK